jgi:hypothetical protein
MYQPTMYQPTIYQLSRTHTHQPLHLKKYEEFNDHRLIPQRTLTLWAGTHLLMQFKLIDIIVIV